MNKQDPKHNKNYQILKSSLYLSLILTMIMYLKASCDICMYAGDTTSLPDPLIWIILLTSLSKYTRPVVFKNLNTKGIIYTIILSCIGLAVGFILVHAFIRSEMSTLCFEEDDESACIVTAFVGHLFTPQDKCTILMQGCHSSFIKNQSIDRYTDSFFSKSCKKLQHQNYCSGEMSRFESKCSEIRNACARPKPLIKHRIPFEQRCADALRFCDAVRPEQLE